MSLHLNRQCQRAANFIPGFTDANFLANRQNEADNHCSPILRPGDCCPSMLATGAFEPFEAAFPSGERASKGDLRFGQTLFAVLFQNFRKWLISAASRYVGSCIATARSGQAIVDLPPRGADSRRFPPIHPGDSARHTLSLPPKAMGLME